jgi:hypothetical protein
MMPLDEVVLEKGTWRKEVEDEKTRSRKKCKTQKSFNMFLFLVIDCSFLILFCINMNRQDDFSAHDWEKDNNALKV